MKIKINDTVYDSVTTAMRVEMEVKEHALFKPTADSSMAAVAFFPDHTSASIPQRLKWMHSDDPNSKFIAYFHENSAYSSLPITRYNFEDGKLVVIADNPLRMDFSTLDMVITDDGVDHDFRGRLFSVARSLDGDYMHVYEAQEH